MYKKLLILGLTILFSIIIGVSAKAAEVYKVITIDDLGYYNIDFNPRTIYVNQGDTLHLRIQNDSRTEARIFIPVFNLDQIIPKFHHSADIYLEITDPPGNVIWFQISSVEKGVPGYIIIRNTS